VILIHDDNADVQADFFDCTAAPSAQAIGRFDRVFDRGALVAVQPTDRKEYVSVIDQLLDAGGQILLVALQHTPNTGVGPPFSVSQAQLEALFDSVSGPGVYTVTKLSDGQGEDVLHEMITNPKWKNAGVTEFYEVAYLIEKTKTGV